MALPGAMRAAASISSVSRFGPVERRRVADLTRVAVADPSSLATRATGGPSALPSTILTAPPTRPCGAVQRGEGRPVTWIVDYGGANCNNSNGIIGYQQAEALGS